MTIRFKTARARSAGLEPLEARRLMAAVSWDGGGTDGRFATAANWSNDVVPTADDDVTIGGTAGATPILFDTFAVRSMRVERLMHVNGALDVAGDLRVASGGNLSFPGGTIGGTGKITVDVGGRFGPATSGSSAVGGDVLLPVDNYGTSGLAGGRSFGPAFHNYGLATAYENGDCFGNFYNEPTGTLLSNYLPSSPGVVSMGKARAADGTIVPGVFVNRGMVRTSALGTNVATTGLTSPGGQPLTLYLNGATSLGGTWNTSTAHLTLAPFASTAPANVTFDSTFALTSGTLSLAGVNATVRGLADGTGLSVTAGATPVTVTIAQARTNLALLSICNGANVTVRIAPGGDRVLRVEDLTGPPNARIDVGDNLLIHGNNPGFGQPWISNKPAPAALPAYQSSVRGNVNGQTLTVATGVDAAASTSRGVGFATGAGLAVHYPARQFRGEAFDDNDFVFFPTLRGDVNLDRDVDFNDLVTLAQNYGTTTARSVADGNVNDPAASGPVDFADLVLLAQNYGVAFHAAPPMPAVIAAPAAGKRATHRKATSDVLGK